MPGSEVQAPGQILRQARLRKGVTLIEAQQATKIRQSFLAALEENDYSILPPIVYVRGFIKNYSAYLDLDSSSMMRLFDELMENIAEGNYLPPTSYGSTDSGGALIQPNPNPQMLAGLSQGEARLVERSAELINLTQLEPAKPFSTFIKTDDLENNSEAAPSSDGDRTETYGSADSSGSKYNRMRFAALRGQQKYVLKPAIQPVGKPSLYMPNFVPFLLVLVILGAAFLLLYRGLAVPAVKDVIDVATPTPNVYSRATVTALPSGISANGFTSSTQSSASSSTGLKPPLFYSSPQSSAVTGSPAPAVTNNKGAPTEPVVTTSPNAKLPGLSPAPVPGGETASAQNTTPPATPTPLGPTIKVEITAVLGPSWTSVLVDGKEQYGKVLAQGQALQVEGKRIAVRAGAPGVIRVKVNGQDKTYASPGSDIITHIWDTSGADTIIK